MTFSKSVALKAFQEKCHLLLLLPLEKVSLFVISFSPAYGQRKSLRKKSKVNKKDARIESVESL